MQQCKVCRYEAESAANLVQHFNLKHRVSAKSLFVCGMTGCSAQFFAVQRYEKHLTQCHRSADITQTSAISNEGSTAESVESADLPIKCAYPGCEYKCSAKSTLRSHRRRHHSTLSEQLPPSACVSLEQDECSSTAAKYCSEREGLFQPVPDNSVLEEEIINDCALKEAHVDAEEDILKSFVHFYLTLSTKFHIPSSTLQFIFEKYCCLLQESVKLLGKKLLNCLGERGVDCSCIEPILQDVLLDDVLVKLHSPKGPMRSRHVRHKQYTRFFNYVPPVGYSLGFNEYNKEREYHYVPIKETLKALFDDDSVYHQYIENRNKKVSDSGLLKDIHDRTAFQTHQVFSCDPAVIQLLVYQDDLEICNPLGAAKCTHKITAYYYSIANLHPWSRSCIDSMQLILLCREKDVSYFGLPVVLKNLIAELKCLEEDGIEIKGEKVKVCLLALLGDNLGTHTVGGFLKNFSRAHFFCRYCEESRSEWEGRWPVGKSERCSERDESETEQEEGGDGYTDCETDDVVMNDVSCSRESDCEESDASATDGDDESDDSCSGVNCDENVYEEVMSSPAIVQYRTPESYNACVELLADNPGGVKGVVSDSMFNQLRYFHIIGGTPPCIGHDILEGIGAADVGLAVEHLVRKYNISIEHINRKMASFPFRGDDSYDKPAKFSLKKYRLGGHAVQNWVTIRFLPLIIGEKITNKRDPVWKLLLLIIQIIQIVFSPTLSTRSLPHLHTLIQKYLRVRVQEFNQRLRPKHHYLEHLPHLISVFGPLIRLWTLRFESKHTTMTATAHAQRNYKNITKSLAKQHQLLQSSLSAHPRFTNYPVMENCMPVESAGLSNATSKLVVDTFGSELLTCMLCGEKVLFRGTYYAKGQVLVTSAKKNYLDLCKILLILMRRKEVYALGVRCEGVLDRRLMAYELHETSAAPTIISLSDLHDFAPYSVYKVKKRSVIVLKHFPC